MRKRDSLKYLEYLRAYSTCVVCGAPRPIISHTQHVGMGANRKKPDIRHFTALPMCHNCHTQGKVNMHNSTRQEFEAYHDINIWRTIFNFVARFYEEVICHT